MVEIGNCAGGGKGGILLPLPRAAWSGGPDVGRPATHQQQKTLAVKVEIRYRSTAHENGDGIMGVRAEGVERKKGFAQLAQ